MIIAIIASVMIGAFIGMAVMACLSMSEKEPEKNKTTILTPGKPLAKPHGRLIDADELLKAFKKACEQDGHWVNFFALVESAPTIIEAEAAEK